MRQAIFATPYKAKVYVAESYMAPPHSTEDADTIRPPSPPTPHNHATTKGRAGGDTIPPPGGAGPLGLHTTPFLFGRGPSSLRSYMASW